MRVFVISFQGKVMNTGVAWPATYFFLMLNRVILLQVRRTRVYNRIKPNQLFYFLAILDFHCPPEITPPEPYISPGKRPPAG